MKKTVKWARFISILAISLGLFLATCYVSALAVSYWSAQDSIRYHEETSAKFGWTDSSAEECHQIRAAQQDMAKAHPLYRWIMNCSTEPFGQFLRNTLILFNFVLNIAIGLFIMMLSYEFFASFRKGKKASKPQKS